MDWTVLGPGMATVPVLGAFVYLVVWPRIRLWWQMRHVGPGGAPTAFRPNIPVRLHPLTRSDTEPASPVDLLSSTSAVGSFFPREESPSPATTPTHTSTLAVRRSSRILT